MNGRNNAHSAATTTTLENVNRENAAHQLCPRRSIVLAFLVPILGGLEGGTRNRQARNRASLAPEAFRVVLEPALPEPSRSTWNRPGDPGADTEDGEI